MAPRRAEEGAPSWDGREGEVVTMRDGSKWEWSDGALGRDGLPIVGGGGGWTKLDATVADVPSAPVAGVPADRPTAPTTTSAAATGGTTTTATSTPPANMTDEQLDAWYQQQLDAAGTEIATLSTEADNAVVELDLAQAAQDPLAIEGARKKLQAIQARLNAASTRQNNYATQQGRIRDRQLRAEAAKDARTMTPEQLAEHEARMAGFKASAETARAQVAENAANRDLTLKRIEWEQAKFLAENDPARLKAADDLAAAQTANQVAETALRAAQANAYPAESAANVGANNASAAANNAQAQQIQALIAAGMPAAQAALTVAQGRASAASAAVSEEDLRQKQIGELGVYAEQLDAQVKQGVLTRLQARDALQAAVDKATTGATPYERQNQTAANSLAFARDAQQAGTLVNMNQRYATGAEPGGAYSQMSENLGYGPYSQPLNPTPLPTAIANIGADVNTPYTSGQLGVPSQMPQAGQQQAAGTPRAVQATGEAAIDWSALTWQQAKALLRGGGGAPTPQTPPQTSVPVMHGGGSVPGPQGV